MLFFLGVDANFVTRPAATDCDCGDGGTGDEKDHAETAKLRTRQTHATRIIIFARMMDTCGLLFQRIDGDNDGNDCDGIIVMQPESPFFLCSYLSSIIPGTC